MGDFTKEELAKIKAKEAGWKAEGDKKVAAKDAEVVGKFKDMIGMGKDFEPRDIGHAEGPNLIDTSPARSPVGGGIGGNGNAEMRSLNMGAKSKATKPSEYKKGGSISGASKRADGCAVKGKTRGKMC